VASRLKCFFAELIFIVAVLKRTLEDAISSNLVLTKVVGRNTAKESILVVFFLERIEVTRACTKHPDSSSQCRLSPLTDEALEPGYGLDK